MKKKLFSILLSLAMVVTMMPMTAMVAFASNGITTWGELQTAITSAESGATIQLTQNIVAEATDSVIEIPSGKEITLDLNGYNIDRNLNDSNFKADGNVITNEGTLTLKDTSDGFGKITGGRNTGAGGGIVNREKGILNLESVSISGNKSSSQNYGGGGVYNEQGIINISGGEISNNEATGSSSLGGGLYNYGKGVVTMTGGMISNNKASNVCGGVYNSGTFTMTGGEIIENQAKWHGGILNEQKHITGTPATLYIGGTALVMDNETLDQGPIANDVESAASGKIIISSEYAPETGMYVGLSGGNTVVQNATEEQEKYFFADESNKMVEFVTEGSKLVISDIPSGDKKINIAYSVAGQVYGPQYASKEDDVEMEVFSPEGEELDVLKVKDATGTDVDTVSNTFEMPESDVTVYNIVFKEITAVLTYDANGHGTAPEAVTMSYSEETYAAKALTAGQYTFTGWNTKADGTGTSYAAGALVKGENVIPTDTTLYAQWKANAPVQTGDSNNMMPWALVMIVSVIALAGISLKRKGN